MIFLLRPKFWQLLAVLILGILFGGAAVTARIGATVDNLVIENKELAQSLETTEDELQEVKKSLADQRRQVITGVEVHVTLSEEGLNHFSEEPLKLTLEKEIQQLLKPVVGQDIKTLNYTLLPQLVEGRVVTAEDTAFVLRVKVIVITDKLIIYVHAAPQKNST